MGAGATGVELAGAIGEIARQTLRNDFRSIRPEEAQIIVVDGAPRVLAAFPEDLSAKAINSLEKLGVEVKTGVMLQTAASDRLISAFRSRWPVSEALRRFYARAAWLQQLVAEELRPRPGRIRTSLRMAFIAAVGSALMAALHIGGVLGPSTLWVALYASSALMTPSEGLIMILVYAVTLIASVILAGILVDAPWILLPFFALATILMTYVLNKQGLVGA